MRGRRGRGRVVRRLGRLGVERHRRRVVDRLGVVHPAEGGRPVGRRRQHGQPVERLVQGRADAPGAEVAGRSRSGGGSGRDGVDEAAARGDMPGRRVDRLVLGRVGLMLGRVLRVLGEGRVRRELLGWRHRVAVLRLEQVAQEARLGLGRSRRAAARPVLAQDARYAVGGELLRGRSRRLDCLEGQRVMGRVRLEVCF